MLGKLLLITLFSKFETQTILSDGIISIEKQAAVLPCTSSTDNHIFEMKPILLRWFHNRFHKPIYTLDLRVMANEQFWNWTTAEGYHFPSHDFEGRLYLDINSVPVTLRIDPVLYEDHGRYTCRIDFKSHRSRISVQDLKVIVPPSGVMIKDKTGKIVNGLLSPLHLGESLNLSCSAIGGHPSPIVSWSDSTNNHQIKHMNAKNIDSHTSQLFIARLERSHQWKKYTCISNNNNITSPMTSTVIIELILPPRTIIIEANSENPFSNGSLLQLTCLCSGSHPASDIFWTIHGNKSLSFKNTVTNNGSLTISRLIKTISIKDNGSEIKCIAKNPSLQNVSLEKSFYINVHYKPLVKVKIMRNDTNQVELQCKIDANPNGIEVKWYFNTEKITMFPNVFQQSNNLHILKLENNQSGTYTCEAKNIQGSTNFSVNFDFKHAPLCREIDMSKHYKENLKHKIVANVTCNLLSNPRNVTFYWLIRNSSTNHNWSTGQIPHTLVRWNNSSLEIACWGKNDLGEQKQPCFIRLIKDLNNESNNDILLIASFIGIFCFLAIFVLTRKLHYNANSNILINEEELNYLKGANRSNNVSTVSKLHTDDDENSNGKLIIEVEL